MVFSMHCMLLVGVIASTASGKEFFARSVDSASVQTDLDDVMAEVFGQGHGVADTRLSKIRKALDPMFRSLPKNKLGHLSTPVMRYAVRRYFSQNHGWMVFGFAPNAQVVDMNALGTNISHTNLPAYVQSILENRFAHEGFSLDAVVVMVASMERLAFDDVVRNVKLAVHLNFIHRSKPLTTENLTEVLSSFFMIGVLGEENRGGNLDNRYVHQKEKKGLHHEYPFWNTTLLFLKDVVGNEVFRRQASVNPFKDQMHSFEDATRIAEQVTEEFGSWSNHECLEMKDMLMEMDVHETGRVKLADFYRYAKNGAWQFQEPGEQLRHGGSLDESSSWLGPQVMIPNYITGISNCVTSTPFYSICCLNECDQVFQHLETHISAPTATPSEIIQALDSGSSALHFNMTAVHHRRLDEMARLSGEKIALHGRLFAQWLHFVFPHECPYPQPPKDIKQMNWPTVSNAEISKHVKSKAGRRPPSQDAGAKMWILEESLLVSSTPSDEHPIFGLLRIAVQISIIVSFASLLARKALSSEKFEGEYHI